MGSESVSCKVILFVQVSIVTASGVNDAVLSLCFFFFELFIKKTPNLCISLFEKTPNKLTFHCFPLLMLSFIFFFKELHKHNFVENKCGKLGLVSISFDSLTHFKTVVSFSYLRVLTYFQLG